MHLFDAREHLHKFESPHEIIEEYYYTRLEFYKKRKEYILDTLQKELIILSNKARFILGNLDESIDLRRKKHDDIIKILSEMKFDPDPYSSHFNYLIKMPMDSVSEEAVNKLLGDKTMKEKKINDLSNMTIENIWLTELIELETEYNNLYNSNLVNKTSKISKTSIIIKKKK